VVRFCVYSKPPETSGSIKSSRTNQLSKKDFRIVVVWLNYVTLQATSNPY
jgi:hypothetical protein